MLVFLYTVMIRSSKGETMAEQNGNLSESALGGQRQIIDDIDQQLVELLSRRAQASLAVAAIKHSAGLPIYFEGREDQVIDRVHEMNSGPYSNMQLTKFFLSIMGESRQLQADYLRQNGDTDEAVNDD